MSVVSIATGRRAFSFAAESNAAGSRFVPNALLGRMRLANEAIGAFTLTLTNLVAGSSVRIELAGSGALVEFRTAASSTEVFSVPAYAAGSVNNDLRIKVRKSSAAPYYRPFETLATASVGAQSIYIAQIQDD